MKLVGFNFTKISSEKKESKTKSSDVKLKTNINTKKQISTQKNNNQTPFIISKKAETL